MTVHEEFKMLPKLDKTFPEGFELDSMGNSNQNKFYKSTAE